MAITTDLEYKSCLSIIDKLWDTEDTWTEEDHEMFNLLATLIDEYEQKRYPIPPPDETISNEQ